MITISLRRKCYTAFLGREDMNIVQLRYHAGHDDHQLEFFLLSTTGPGNSTNFFLRGNFCV